MSEGDPIRLLLFGAPAGPCWRAAIGDAGFALREVPDLPALRQALREQPGRVCGVLLDLRDIDDPALLRALGAELAQPRIRGLCVQGGAAGQRGELAELSLRYCIDTLRDPVPEAVLRLSLDSLRRRLRLIEQVGGEPAVPRATGPGPFIGASPAMQRLEARLERVAATDAAVLITGETGVGKELVAQAIHRLSARRDKPFVAINCGAVPAHLLQSELFGHEKGAFTGAAQRRIGRIEAAGGGTLLLDEIGDLPLDAQVGLLRFLQEGQVERLGGHSPIAVDLRILSATHVDLLQAQRAARFRTDLYHRLCVIELQVPALRERGDDVLLLAQYALQRYRGEARHPIEGFDEGVRDALLAHEWPGNIRELINRVRRAIVLCESGRIGVADLGLEAADGRAEPARGGLDAALGRATSDAIHAALERNGHVVARAARDLGVSRATLYRMMERHGLAGAQPRHDAGAEAPR